MSLLLITCLLAVIIPKNIVIGDLSFPADFIGDYNARKTSACSSLLAERVAVELTIDRNTNNTHDVCRFSYNPLHNVCYRLFKKALDCTKYNWYCEVLSDQIGDGFSHCLYDECHCSDTDVFYCAYGRGCVAMGQVYDITPGCLDASDEILCPKVQKVLCQRGTVYVSPCNNNLHHFEKLKFDLDSSSKNCTDISSNKICLEKIFDFSTQYIPKMEPYTYSTLCHEYCTNVSSQFCQRLMRNELYKGIRTVPYFCNTNDSRTVRIIGGTACDKIEDDELFCIDRFYCTELETPSLEWADLRQVCDGDRDCSSGLDECSNCFKGPFSDDNQLISSNPIRYIGVLVVILIFGFNGYSAWERLRMKSD